MYGKPLNVMEDEVVEHRRRIIHEFEHRNAEVSAWHGGRKICVLGCQPSIEAAREFAESEGKRLSVTPRSSLRIRILLTRERHFQSLRRMDGDRPIYDADKPMASRFVERRHVWDDGAGAMAVRPHLVEFEIGFPVGMRGGDDPGAGLAQIVAGAEVSPPTEDWYFAGVGIGGVTVTSNARIELDGRPEIVRDSPTRSLARWAMVVTRGWFPVDVPVGLSIVEASQRISELSVAPVLRIPLGEDVARLALYAGLARARLTFPAPLDLEAGIGPSSADAIFLPGRP